MFKRFFWKEWRQAYAVVLFASVTMLIYGLYMVLRHHESAEGLRNVLCFLFWPSCAVGFAWLLFFQETWNETLEFLFSKPLAKHGIWFIKVSCGLIYILLMCVMSFLSYFLVAYPSSILSSRSLVLDPYLLVGFCFTISVFSIALWLSTIWRRRGRLFGTVLGVAFSAMFVAFVMLTTSPYFDEAVDRLKEKPIILSFIVLGVAPLFFFVSFISFNRGELLNMRRRRTIISYFLSGCVILLMLNAMATYIWSIGYLPSVGGAVEMVAVSPDGRTILLLREERSPFMESMFAFGGGEMSIYAMDSDGKNLRRLMRGGCSDPVWSPGGEKICFLKQHGWFSQSLYVMDRDGSNPVKIRTFPFMAWVFLRWPPAWSPDGKRMVYVNAFTKDAGMIDEMPQLLAGPYRNRQCLTISHADGSGSTDIRFPVLDDAIILPPVWARDGTIYFRRDLEVGEEQRGWRVWKIEAGETGPQRIEEESGPISSFWVSPKGWFAYTTVCKEQTQEEGEEKQRKVTLFVKNEKGEKVLEAPDICSLVWSPDGMYLAYVTAKREDEEKKQEMDCSIFDTVTRKERTIPLGKHSRRPKMKWSPDNERILFIFRGREEDVAIQVLSIGEGSPVELLGWKGLSEDVFAEWIGVEEILYQEESCLWVIKADGTDKRRIFSFAQ